MWPAIWLLLHEEEKRRRSAGYEPELPPLWAAYACLAVVIGMDLAILGRIMGWL